MSNGSRRLSRGDRRRNDRLAALRAVVTRETAVLAFDLAADKQVCALTDQDSRVLARRTVKAKAWQLAEAVSWGLAQATAAGFSSVVVACEPTGHRWRMLDQIAAGLSVRLVCVQPLLVHRARESEDFTRNKSDERDAMIIARLVIELRCYLPERAGPVWARLRHLGARRAALVTDATAARQQVADLLECAWPAALEAAGKPMKSKSWLAPSIATTSTPSRQDAHRSGAGSSSSISRAARCRREGAAGDRVTRRPAHEPSVASDDAADQRPPPVRRERARVAKTPPRPPNPERRSPARGCGGRWRPWWCST